MHSKFSTIRLLEVPSLCHSYLTCTPIGYVVKPRDPTACWKNAGVCPYELIAHLLRARPIVTQPNKPLNVLLPQKVQSTGCISFLSSPYFPPAPATSVQVGLWPALCRGRHLQHVRNTPSVAGLACHRPTCTVLRRNLVKYPSQTSSSIARTSYHIVAL